MLSSFWLRERGGRTRGANITSLDALMLRRGDGDPCLVVFEGKYPECYRAKCVAVSNKGTDRVKTYQSNCGSLQGSALLVGDLLIEEVSDEIRWGSHRTHIWKPSRRLSLPVRVLD